MMPTEDAIQLQALRTIVTAGEIAAYNALVRARHLGDQDTVTACRAELKMLLKERWMATFAIKDAEKAL